MAGYTPIYSTEQCAVYSNGIHYIIVNRLIVGFKDNVS